MADVTSEYAAANGWREIDLSKEIWREYYYPKGESRKFLSGGRLFIRSEFSGLGGESHRLVLPDGVCFRPSEGGSLFLGQPTKVQRS